MQNEDEKEKHTPNIPLFSKQDNLYDWISCLISNSVYFGAYPTPDMIDILKEKEFTHIINLTENEYPHNDSSIKFIHYPIIDHSIPEDPMTYCKLIYDLKLLVLTGNKLYIHCRGGHGRSGMLSASLWFVSNSIKIDEAIEYVNKCHTNRVVLREKWRGRKFPFNYKQFIFLQRMHKCIYIGTDYFSWILPKYYEIGDKLYKIDEYFELVNDQKDEQFQELFYFFFKRFSENNEYRLRFQLTYLKSFVYEKNKHISQQINNVLSCVRDYMYYI